MGFFGSLISGIFGAGSSQAAANAQVQATRETNETNLRLAREQNSWNEMMWNKSNEYNSPSAQVSRLRAAGLNPNLVNDAGSSTPVQSANLANQQTPDYSGFYRMGDFVSRSVDQALQSIKIKSDVEKAKADISESKTRQNVAETLLPYQKDYQAALARGELVRAGISEKSLKYFDINQRMTLAQILAQTNKTIADEAKVRADIDYQVRTNKFIEKLNDAQLAKLASAVRSDNSIAALNETLNQFRSKGIGVSNHWISDLVGLSISNPDEVSKAIDNLVSSGKNSFKTVGKNVKGGLHHLPLLPLRIMSGTIFD